MKKRGYNQKGITLIILVVTIVVILILAAITVDLAFDGNGIIKRAQGLQETINQSVANEEYELGKLTNQLEGSIINAGIGENPNINDIGGGGEESEVPQKPKIKVNGTQGEEGYYRSDVEIVVTANDRAHTLTYTVEGTGIDQGSVETETNIGNGQSIYIKQDGEYTIKVYAYNRYGKKSDPTTIMLIRDTVEPTGDLRVTTKEQTSITVQLVVDDAQPSAGLASETPYTFYYKETGTENWIEAGKGSVSSYTYEGLEEGISYDLKAEITDRAGNTGTSNTVENVNTSEEAQISGITDWTETLLHENDETSFTITTTAPVKIEDATKVILQPNTTDSTVKIEAINPDENGYATEFKVTIVGGAGNGEEGVIVGEGTLVSKNGTPLPEVRKDGVTIENFVLEVTTKNNDNNGENYAYGTWTNTNLYTDISATTAKEVEKYQYSIDNGQTWKDISAESGGIHAHVTFQPGEEKPDVIGELQNAEGYHFEPIEGGGIINNNAGQDETVAQTYLPIDLTEYPDIIVKLTIHSTISSEEGYDFGYIGIIPDSLDNYESEILLLQTSGENKEEMTNYMLKGGKKYYIDFRYGKDSSDSGGTDTFTIHSMDIQEMFTASDYLVNFPLETTRPDYVGALQHLGTYQFVENGSGGITSNNQGILDSIAHSYIPLDLTNYAEKEIYITVDASISSEEGFDEGKIILANSLELSDETIQQEMEALSGEQRERYSINLEGGNLYYLHFIYEKNDFGSEGEDQFTIHTIQMEELQEREGGIRFAEYLKNNNNIHFYYKENLDMDIQYRAVCTDGYISQPTQNYSIKIDKQRPRITKIEGPSKEFIKQGDTSTMIVHFSEPVEFVLPENIVLSGSAGSSVEASLDETGTIMTIVITGGTGEGAIEVTIPEGCLLDKANNSMQEQILSGITVDNTAPTIIKEEGPEAESIYEGKANTTLLTFDEPVVIATPENIKVTGTASEGCKIETSISEDGITVTIRVIGGTGQGDIEIEIPEGTITDRAGNVAPEHTITGIHIDNIAPELTLKYNNSTGKEYPQGTWTNENVYSEVFIEKEVEKYQYSSNGNQWYDILEEGADTSLTHTMQFPIDETKPGFIGDITPSNDRYYFVDDGNGGMVSNNKGVDSTTASSYIVLNLEDYSPEDILNITVNATISGETNYDFGYATITNDTTVPSYDDSTGQFIKYSGSVSTIEETTSISGGKTYYLHFGYRKDGSGYGYNDEMMIHSITFQSDAMRRKMHFYGYNKIGNRGTYTLQDEIKTPLLIRAIYTDGKISKPVTSDVKIDKTAPVIEEVQASSYESLSEGTVKVTVLDEGQVGSYYLSKDNTPPAEDSNWIEEENNPFTISGIQADTPYYIWVKDKAGNVSESKEFQITQANYQIDTTGYSATLEQAIEKANENATIFLLRDYTDESKVNFTKDLTFDTGNYTLERYENIIMSNRKNVVLQGNGKIRGGVHNLIHNVSTLTIKGNITIESLDGDAIENYATIYVQDEATIYGGTAIYNDYGGTVNIEGGNISAGDDGVYGGIVNVLAGKIEANRYGVWGNGDDTITIGDNHQVVSESNPIIYGSISAVNMHNEPAEKTFHFYNGKLESDQQPTYSGILQARDGYIDYTYYGYAERAYCTILGTEVSEIQIQADPTTWTNQDVSITIYYPNLENTTKQYSIDGINWKNTEETRVDTNVSENTTIYARILDSNQVIVKETEKVIEYIDKIEPTVIIEPATTHYYITDEQPTAHINFTLQVEEQGGSGIATKTYAWTTGEETPTYMDFANGTQIQKTLGEGMYTLWLQVTDVAGNMAELRKVPFIVEYKEPVAQIGETTYTTIQEAVDACEEGTQTTIIMLKSTEEEVKIPENKNVIVDLQGYTIGSYHPDLPIFQNAGILQIIDETTQKTGILEHYTGTAIQNTGTLTIGDATSQIENQTPTIKGAKIGIQNTATLNYYDGTIHSKTPIHGNITDTPEGYGPVASYENGTTIVTLDIVADYVARIEYHYYTTLQNAIDACIAKENNTNQQEITILKNIVLDKTVTTYKGQNIKLDLDRYTISSSTIEKGIINNGDLEITDESVEKTGKIEISGSSENINGIWNNSTGRIKISRRNG